MAQTEKPTKVPKEIQGRFDMEKLMQFLTVRNAK